MKYLTLTAGLLSVALLSGRRAEADIIYYKNGKVVKDVTIISEEGDHYLVEAGGKYVRIPKKEVFIAQRTNNKGGPSPKPAPKPAPKEEPKTEAPKTEEPKTEDADAKPPEGEAPKDGDDKGEADPNAEPPKEEEKKELPNPYEISSKEKKEIQRFVDLLAAVRARRDQQRKHIP